MGNVAPYLGVEALFLSDKPGGFFEQEPGVKTRLQTGLMLGAEYYMGLHFSLGFKERIDTEFGISRSAINENNNGHVSTKGEITGRFKFNGRELSFPYYFLLINFSSN
jgi:hypothetical protein